MNRLDTPIPRCSRKGMIKFLWGAALLGILLPSHSLGGDEWYISNVAGMTLEYLPSRAAALRNKYALQVQIIPIHEIPPLLREYWKEEYTGELRILYEDKKEIRRQYLYRDPTGQARCNASGEGLAFGAPEKSPRGESSKEVPQGFIDCYNEAGLVTLERRFFSDGEETRTEYYYNGEILLRGEIFDIPALGGEGTGEKEGDDAGILKEKSAMPDESPPPHRIAVDYYRYTRAGSLRAIDRRLEWEATPPGEGTKAAAKGAGGEGIGEEAESAEGEKAGEETPAAGGEKTGESPELLEKGEERGFSRLPFPRLRPDFSESPPFVIPGVAYSSPFLSEPLGSKDNRIVYTTDSRGRVLLETHLDKEDKSTGQLENVWSGDRISSMHWTSGDEDRRTEYEYDGQGRQILQKDYNRGVLERTIKTEGNRELEELYKDGQVILRAIYEDGHKISEELVRED